MIRRTVARAFGMSGDEPPRMETSSPKGAKGSRMALVNQLFTDLQERFEKSVREIAASAGEDVPPESIPRITKVRPRPEGLEFILELPSGAYRFLDSMDGIIWIFREEDRCFLEDRLLTIQFEGEVPRIIERPTGMQRSPFRYTSVPRLVKDFLPFAGENIVFRQRGGLE